MTMALWIQSCFSLLPHITTKADISMQGSTDEASASIPTENERNGGRMSGVRRKFADLLKHLNPFSAIPRRKTKIFPQLKSNGFRHQLRQIQIQS
jgi:hypothetical protein